MTSSGESWLEHYAAALAEFDRGEMVLKLAQSTPSRQFRIDLPIAYGRLFVMPILFIEVDDALDLGSAAKTTLFESDVEKGRESLFSTSSQRWPNRQKCNCEVEGDRGLAVALRAASVTALSRAHWARHPDMSPERMEVKPGEPEPADQSAL